MEHEAGEQIDQQAVEVGNLRELAGAESCHDFGGVFFANLFEGLGDGDFGAFGEFFGFAEPAGNALEEAGQGLDFAPPSYWPWRTKANIKGQDNAP